MTSQSRSDSGAPTSTTKTARAIGLDVFYPIVPDAIWAVRLVPLGIKTIQLRMKNITNNEVRRDITEVMTLCETHNCQLIVNDYWREAIDLGANFVHLGQEDLAMADLQAIKSADIKLGLSTHNEAELETAISARPDYIALGPIYETKLKAMAWAPQGLDKLVQWKNKVGPIPLVGIGGLTPKRATAVIEAGAQSVSVITDFLTHPNPENRVREWLRWAKNH